MPGCFPVCPHYELSVTIHSFPEVRQLRYGSSLDVPKRRIDDRIRALCARLTACGNGDLEPILQELLELVHRKNERLARRAARLLLKGQHLEPERRAMFQSPDTKIRREPV